MPKPRSRWSGSRGPTATTDWHQRASSGKNGPDVTELGNTDTPAKATLGMLANITSNVNSWSTSLTW